MRTEQPFEIPTEREAVLLRERIRFLYEDGLISGQSVTSGTVRVSAVCASTIMNPALVHLLAIATRVRSRGLALFTRCQALIQDLVLGVHHRSESRSEAALYTTTLGRLPTPVLDLLVLALCSLVGIPFLLRESD